MAFPNISILLALMIVMAVVKGDDFQMPDFSGGGFGGGGRSVSCPAYKCGSGLEPAPKSYRPVASGCAGMGGGMVMSMGNDAGPLEDCCSRRTACFQTCGSSKKQCEKQFETCTKDTCSAMVDPEERKSCDSSASLQTMLANMNQDCREFNNAQASACQCLTPEKAVAKREKTLKELYKKFSPDQIEKVDGLMTKAGSDVKKFSALLNKFVAKFSQVIRIKKTEQQEMYENIMREAKENKPSKSSSEDKEEREEGREDDLTKDTDGSGGDELEDLDNMLKQEL